MYNFHLMCSISHTNGITVYKYLQNQLKADLLCSTTQDTKQKTRKRITPVYLSLSQASYGKQGNFFFT